MFVATTSATKCRNKQLDLTKMLNRDIYRDKVSYEDY